MQNKILNKKEIKKIKEALICQFGYFWEEDYVYLLNENDRLFIINKDLAKIELQKVHIDRIGLYVAEVKKEQLRLSKEGSLLLVTEARKKKKKIRNIIDLTKEEVKSYFQGNDLEKDLGTESKFMLLQYQKNVLGCAKYKEGKIINFLPKIHRGEVIL
ncbi:hypothetical protein J4421_01280 [Candidatus Woesearchaeota archaeon]|nr:hypothetical protein [Candidatus Woesearchaeota archaeon]